MENIKTVSHGIICGMRDSVCGTIMVFQLDRAQSLVANSKRSRVPPEELSTLARRRAAAASPKPDKSPRREEPRVVHRILQCCALNGGVFWISILAFHGLFLPALSSLTHLIFGGSPVLAVTVWSWMKPTLSYTFGALWVLPLFVLSKIVNGLWFQDIADSAYRHTRGRPQLLPGFSKLLADSLFSVLIQALFLVQGMLAGLLPIAGIGRFIGVIHMCLLYAMYAFEYKWFNMGWELHKRLSFIENNWPYFVGFGLPLALLTALPSSYVISGCVFSILFPLFIISGNEAEPFIGTCDYALRLFSPVVCLSNAIFNRTIMRSSIDDSPRKLATSSPAHRSTVSSRGKRN